MKRLPIGLMKKIGSHHLLCLGTVMFMFILYADFSFHSQDQMSFYLQSLLAASDTYGGNDLGKKGDGTSSQPQHQPPQQAA